jgi:hypothetical protein
MSLRETILNLFPGSPVLSIITVVAVLNILLYLARKPVHRAFLALAKVFKNALRIAAQSILHSEKSLKERNREVLLAAGIDATERMMEREFRRVEETLKRDLYGYPALQRKLSELVAKIDEDYRESTEVPPTPPEWVKVVDSVSKIPASETLVSRLLKEIHNTLQEQEKKATDEFRKSTSKRHALLQKLMPYWRSMSSTLNKVDTSIGIVLKRSSHIDKQIDGFEEMRKGTEKITRTLSSSSLTQFFISGLVLLIAVGGAMVNFNLIALPMSEMVGGGSYIGPFRASSVAALVIILVETTLGLFLMESFRITRLFPIISTMDDTTRRRLMWASFLLLTILASVESSLAYMRDQIAGDIQALRGTLSGIQIEQAPYAWIPMVGQMVMGFILPFALLFVAIPLESFIHSSRTVLGIVAAATLRTLAFILRFAGNISVSIAKFINTFYDLLIFPPLWFEDLVSGKGHSTERNTVQHSVSMKETIEYKDSPTGKGAKMGAEGGKKLKSTGVFDNQEKG